MLLKNIRFILTNEHIIENCDILIENNKIKSIKKNISTIDKEVIDCSNKIILPGLINLHLHGGMNILRGISDDLELNEWLNTKIWPAEKKLNEKDIYYASLISYFENLFSGTTTIVDAYFEIDSMKKAAENSNIRAFLSPAIFNQNDIEKVKKNNFFLQKNNSKIKPFIFLHSIYATDKKTLNDTIDFCNKNNIIKAIHISETRNELIEIKNNTKLMPINYLLENNFFEKKSLLIHCIWLTKNEINLIKEKNTSIVHCPSSNMKLASGATLPLIECFNNNINIGLGTDSAVSNNCLDLFNELKLTALLQKHHRWDATVAKTNQIINMPFENGAKALGIDNLGSIKENNLADLISLNLNEFNLLDTDKNTLISNIIYSANRSNVCDVIVDGKILIKNKNLQTPILDFNGNEISLEKLKDIVNEIKNKIL